MKYYIIAGEASGDLHGSNLIKELRKLDDTAEFRAWGGDRMEAAGAKLVKHYRDLAFMGIVEVLKNIFTILKNFKFCRQDILAYRPDIIILVDYPGFNLRIAKWAKQNDYKVVFYISPQVWAWKESRVKMIKKYVDTMIVILPFEEEFYKKWDYKVYYVGHPLVEVVDNFKSEFRVGSPESGAGSREMQNVVAILPGSRKQEIKAKLPIMLSAAESFKDYRLVVAKAPGIEDDFYSSFLFAYNNVETVSNKTYSILSVAKAAMVTSGTATLETALFEVPQVVCYRGGWISYQIAKRLIKLKFICLVNLIMNKEVVKELIQNDLTVENLKHELHELLTNNDKIVQVKRDYRELRNILSAGGNASENAAKIIYSLWVSSEGV